MKGRGSRRGRGRGKCLTPWDILIFNLLPSINKQSVVSQAAPPTTFNINFM
jgi:hypothetical protein